MTTSERSEQSAGAADPAPGAARGGGAAPPGAGAGEGAPGGAASLAFVADVPLRVSVEIGSTRMRVRDVLMLDEGAVIELDRLAGEPADVLVNGRLVARGALTVVDDRLAVSLTEVVAGASAAPPRDGSA